MNQFGAATGRSCDLSWHLFTSSAMSRLFLVPGGPLSSFPTSLQGDTLLCHTRELLPRPPPWSINAADAKDASPQRRRGELADLRPRPPLAL